MNNRKRRLLGGILLLAVGVAFSGAVFAQTPGAVGQPAAPVDPRIQAQAPAIGENYDPKGMPLGSFQLFPALELDEVYNDNIYAVPTASGKTGSFIQVIKPSLNLR